MNDLTHAPVLLAECLTALAIRPDGVYVDATFGRGGHSSAILDRLDRGQLFAIDRDAHALGSPRALLLSQDRRVKLLHGCFSNCFEQPPLSALPGQVNGILMDLGVSSPQLDDPERGFSFRHDGPLDMRMGQGAQSTAAEWLAQVSEAELVKVLFDYGEERFAHRIARAIITTRVQQPITRTGQLAELVSAAMPFHERHKHPATRTFQAIRIAVNHELDELTRGLSAALTLLAPGGRLAVIAFHSLEDRLVKRFLRAESRQGSDPGRLPVLEQDIPRGRLKLIGKAIKASPQEIADNTRARSAILRVAEAI
ncbi:MAG: 16S rRNA (cytosine(1402)-N(4))-methyltransferase RsmH [Methylococcales bacterium]|nr:16S rRNA (cytosine(1402)-N(4))-methyltransferase RsmH [Methylococcales bacterium]